MAEIALADAGSPVKRKRRWWWKITLLVLLVLVGVWGGWRIWTRIQLNRELDRIRAEGYPTTVAEYEAWRPKIEGPNGAEVYIQAFTKLMGDDELYMKLPGLGAPMPSGNQPLSTETVESIRKCLELNREAMVLVRRAAMIQECHFTIDASKGMLIAEIPHLRKIKRCANILAAEALLNAAEARSEDAVASILTMLRLCDAVKNDKFLISELVRIAIFRLTSITLEAVVQRIVLSEDQLVGLQRAFEAAVEPAALVDALASERCSGLDLFDHPETCDIYAKENVRKAMWFWKTTGINDCDKLYYLSTMRGYIDRARRPIENLEIADGPKGGDMPFYAIVCHALLPSYGGCMRAEARQLAERQLDVAAIAVLRYQADNNRWPDHLDDLAPKYLGSPPVDPFDNRLLRYIKSGSTIKLYSVGFNRVDDGGVEDSPSKSGKTGDKDGDFVFTIHP